MSEGGAAHHDCEERRQHGASGEAVAVLRTPLVDRPSDELRPVPEAEGECAQQTEEEEPLREAHLHALHDADALRQLEVAVVPPDDLRLGVERGHRAHRPQRLGGGGSGGRVLLEGLVLGGGDGVDEEAPGEAYQRGHGQEDRGESRAEVEGHDEAEDELREVLHHVGGLPAEAVLDLARELVHAGHELAGALGVEPAHLLAEDGVHVPRAELVRLSLAGHAPAVHLHDAGDEADGAHGHEGHADHVHALLEGPLVAGVVVERVDDSAEEHIREGYAAAVRATSASALTSSRSRRHPGSPAPS